MPVQTSVSDAPSVAFAGLLVGTGHTLVGMVNAEASAEMPYGLAVAFKPSGSTHDQQATVFAAITDKVAGVVIKSDVYDRTYTLSDGSTAGELGAIGLRPGAMMNILRKGQVWVVCEDGCAPGDKLYVRAVVGSPTNVEFAGSLLNAADGVKTIDATVSGTWMTTAVAGGLAVLSLDLA